MTAEIAILNKSAVALAADSAVTLQTSGGQKIYNTVNKLFTLSKYRPVGIMIYGNSEFMTIPWESIIKEHRRQIKEAEYRTLKEYADAFVTWLAGEKTLFPEGLQADVLMAIARSYFEQIRQQINDAVAGFLSSEGSIEDEKVTALTDKVIASHQQFWKGTKALPFPEDYEQRFLKNHYQNLERLRKSVFEELPMSAETAAKLIGLVPLAFSRDSFQPNASGIVIAGFGSEEIFPSLISLQVEALVEGTLKWKTLETAQISSRATAAIMPFAQREMVDTFLTGVDPQFKRTVLGSVTPMLQGIVDQIFKQIPVENLPKRDEQAAAVKAGIPKIVGDLDQLLNGYSRTRHIDPIMSAVGALPKDELAAMAESLVNLTSFKRRVSIESETVGGEIDVAVISKGDGFIWIKRKHYFDSGKNPHFMVNYYR